jgi:hypothetical protein
MSQQQNKQRRKSKKQEKLRQWAAKSKKRKEEALNSSNENERFHAGLRKYLLDYVGFVIGTDDVEHKYEGQEMLDRACYTLDCLAAEIGKIAYLLTGISTASYDDIIMRIMEGISEGSGVAKESTDKAKDLLSDNSKEESTPPVEEQKDLN